MSDHTPNTHPTTCERFEDWLLEGGDASEIGRWTDHLGECASCREQWTSHQLLMAAFVEQPVPDLSPAFQAGLDRKVRAARIKVSPLTGWRRAALVAYAAIAVALMAWVLDRFPLPSIDLTSPWATLTAMLIVPLSLWVTMVATRLLPRSRPRSVGPLAF